MRKLLPLAAVLIVVALVLPAAGVGRAAGSVSFVQNAFARIGVGDHIDVAFTSPPSAGDVVVAYVVWDNADAADVSDSQGNAYTSAAGAQTWFNGGSAQVFYATLSTNGDNTVTVRFSTPVNRYGLVYIHEYTGIDTSNPVDAASSSAGASGALDSGPLVTTHDNDLLFLAGASSNAITGVPPGFSVRSTASDNLTADQIVSSAGTYSATAGQNGNQWVTQIVAFRGVDTEAPSQPATVPAAEAPAPAPESEQPAPTAAPTPVALPTASTPPAVQGAAYPLKQSGNGRYLVDQNGTPFLLAGDSPQSIIGNVSVADADLYFANRQAHGFNAAWINLLCNDYTYCKSDGRTFDGIAPFTTPGDLATPNPAYFSKVDSVIQSAAKHGIVVFLDPIETGGWLPVLRSNGVGKARSYGEFIGNRYKGFPNIVWQHGNDFQSWGSAGDDALAVAVASGIQATDSNHLHTIELNYNVSGSLDDPNWAPIVGLDAAYTYYPTFDRVLKEYNRASMPVYLVEANYEFEHNFTDQGTPAILRRQEYWTLLSGAAGQLYGNLYTVRFQSGWKDNLDTPGARELGVALNFFGSRPWFNLVPDQNHSVVVAGYGTYDANATVAASDYATTARTGDGRLVIAYLPTARTLSVDMSRLAGAVTGRWFDPVAGSYVPIGDGLPNSGTRQFTPPPDAHADGAHDWVLVLETG